MLEWLSSDGPIVVYVYADRSSVATVLDRATETAVTGTLEEHGELLRQSIDKFSKEACVNGFSPQDF